VDVGGHQRTGANIGVVPRDWRWRTNHGGKSQAPPLELRFPLDDKAVNDSVVVTETEGLLNQEVMVGLIVLLAVGFILAKLPKT